MGRDACLDPRQRALPTGHRKAAAQVGTDDVARHPGYLRGRRWGYFALPILHHDRQVGKVDAAASVLQVNAIHEDVKFTRTITKAVQAELEDLASWLGLDAVEGTRR